MMTLRDQLRRSLEIETALEDARRAAETRNQWLMRSAEQIKRWRADDAASGQPWERDL
jgi:hypothetical protein